MLKLSEALAYAWRYTGNTTYLKIAAQLFKVGSKYFWFEGNPVGKFATGKQHAILSTSGAHYMTIAYRSPAIPLVDARARWDAGGQGRGSSSSRALSARASHGKCALTS